jgi:hypothetical protein
MKKIIIVLCFIPFIGFSQVCDSIKITTNDFPPVVIELKGKTDAEIYSKVKSWINRYYKNPDIVIKADEKDKYIRISSVSNFTYKYITGAKTDNYKYSFEIDIKEGKYRITFFDLSFDRFELPQFFFNKKGEVISPQKIYKGMIKSLMNDVNKTNFDLYNYVNSIEKDF